MSEITLWAAARVRSEMSNPVGGGGYSVWKRVPTAVRPLRSSGCRNSRWLYKERGAVLLLYCKIRELSESLHAIFYII